MSLSQHSSSLSTFPHRALVCYDILCYIFEKLAVSEAAWYDYDPLTGDANSWYTRGDFFLCRTTLARSARVCRAFFAPAVTVLWRDLDGLSPLISLLRVPTPSTSPSALEIARNPRWNVMAFEYSQRVHSVHGFGSPLSSTDLEFLDGLSTDGVIEQFLPQLRHLRWAQPGPLGMEILRIITPSLQSLHIVFGKSFSSIQLISACQPYVRQFLQEVVARAPRLRYLRISTNGNIEGSWLDSIGCFDHLQTVDLLDRVYSSVTTTSLIRPLSSLQELQHLSIRLPAKIPSDVETAAFPSLRSLTLDAMFAPLPAVSDFLSLISSRALSSLIVQNCECTTSALGPKLYTVCDVIRTRFAPSLRQIDLSLRSAGPVITTTAAAAAASHDTPPPMRTLEPLLALHDLDDVRIAIAPDIAVVPATTDDLAAMAAAWPRATRLHLCYSAPSPVSPSLSAVAGFALHCAGLTDLVLPGIDASAPLEPGPEHEHGQDHCDATAITKGAVNVSAGRKRVAHRLRSLCLSDAGWHSRIPDPTRLARFLDGLFPEVEWKCPPLASEHWQETIQEVLQLRISRMLRVVSGGGGD